MTAPTATIQTTSRTVVPSGAESEERVLASLGVGSAAFAELLAATGGMAHGGVDRREAAMADKGERPAHEHGRPDDAEGHDQATTRGDAAGALPSGAVPDAPLTIRSLNRTLLREAGGGGADAHAASDSGEPATPGTRAAGAKQSSEGGAARGASSDAAGEARRGGAEAAPTPKASASADAPEATPARVHEGASPAASNTQAAAGAAPGVALKALSGGAARDLAAAVRAQTGGGRVVTAGTASGGSGGGLSTGAQGSRGAGKVARAAQAPPAASAEAKAEVFRAQVARGIAAALEKGNGTLTMRLKPEALGRLNVKVSMKEGVLTAQFQAQTREARDLLVSTAADLRRALETAGVKVERIEATVAPEPSAWEAGGSSGAGEDWSGGPGGRGGGESAVERSTGGRAAHAAAPDGRSGTESASGTEERTDWISLGLDTIA